ncbi:MAG: tetratricopeptide repeat protein [Sediminicola sp.]
MKKRMFRIYIACMAPFLFVLSGHAQENDAEREKALRTSKNHTWEGNKELSEGHFVTAEAEYRKAISKSTENAAAPYNLGNAYYENETYNEAFSRFKQAGELATDKADKHKAYHNMGNVFMKNKQYEKAVEAYKQALRNDPTDEETRYNLALAKELLKKQQDEEKKNDQNKDNKDDQNKEDQKEKDKNEGDSKDQKNDQKKDQGDEGDKGDQKDKEDEKKEGEGDQKQDPQKKPGEGEQPNDQQQQQPRPNQLSPQQVENLLEAMQNEEKKVKEKIDAQKVKGVKVKNEKDW